MGVKLASSRCAAPEEVEKGRRDAGYSVFLDPGKIE